MSVKIIFTDLDGTLLSGGQVAISARNMEALKAASDQGVLIVPCTGRCVDMLPPQLLTADFVRYVVSCHGARVCDRKTGKTIHEDSFTPEESYEILKIIEGRGIYTEIAANNKIYVEKSIGDALADYPVPIHHDWYMRDRRFIAVDSIAEYFLHNRIGIDKVNIYSMPDEICEEVYRRLEETGVVKYTYPWVSPNLEFCRYTLRKKSAVQTLLDTLGIRKDEVFAIGDSHADCDLLELAGISVAMGNAVDILKSVARYETDVNTADGVGKAIERYVLDEGASADPVSAETFKKKNNLLVCIDSDGCAVDTMEIKHKECFCTAFIECFGLQGIAKYAREAWEYTNLYSKTRGLYRMKTLVLSIELLSKRREVVEKGFRLPDITELKKWLRSSPVLNDASLLAYAESHDDKTLYTALEWSAETNRRIKRIVRNVPPFLYVRESLEKLHGKADIIVVSATPTAALENEWSEHDIKKYTAFICGQEYGAKRDVISKFGKQYGEGRILMIGDAMGDHQAATEAGSAFYPIFPNAEDSSWKNFHDSVSDIFTRGEYTPEMQEKYVDRLKTILSDRPGWDEV
ncbi:MAG: HAD family hydrolase [Eubacteriales bacterium]